MNHVVEPSRKTAIFAEPDVLVVGGGMTGVAAAVSASRMGKKTMLIDSKPCLGGVATMGLPFQGFFDSKKTQIVKGVAQEVVDRLRTIGGASEPIYCEMHNPFLIIEPEAVKMVCQEILLENGVDILLHTVAVDVLAKDGRLDCVLIENKSGRSAIRASVYVDATGDGDIATRCGVPFSIGREQDGLTQSATLNFRLAGVDTLALTRRVLEDPEHFDLLETLPRAQFRVNRRHIMVGLSKLIEQAEREGLHGIPWNRVCYITMLDDESVTLNMVHVKGRLGCDGRQLSEIELEARKQVPVVIAFLNRYVPGFERARLVATAGWTGIRETRHINGDYTLTEKDVTGAARFPDAIAVGGYPVDIHTPSTAEGLSFFKVPTYDIPYRCLLPIGMRNLLTAGRCISATHVAMASARQMATCMAMGHAAGAAAVLAAGGDGDVHRVPVAELQSALKAQGAYLQG
jgi:hypothetical protein